MSKTPNTLEIHRMKFIAEVPRWHYRHASTPTWRFYWNPLPGAWLKSGDKTIELLPETAVLIPPQTPFAAGADKTFSHFFVHFSIPLYCNPDKRQIWTLKSKDVILEEFQKELPHLSGQRMFWTAASIVQAALTRLPQDVFSECEPERENLFDKAVKFLDQDHAYSLSYAELAHLCGTSINTLQRQFVSATGWKKRYSCCSMTVFPSKRPPICSASLTAITFPKRSNIISVYPPLNLSKAAASPCPDGSQNQYAWIAITPG